MVRLFCFFIVEKEKVIIPPGGFNRRVKVADTVILALIPHYLAILKALARARRRGSAKVDFSRVYSTPHGFMLAGPAVSSPVAALLVESLFAFGAKNIIAVGLVGSVDRNVRIGDIVIPTGAISEEGTSSAYDPETNLPIPDEAVTDKIREAAGKYRVKVHEGKIWTTDAPYRETADKVLKYSAEGALGVEMELSALFTVARFRKKRLGAVLAVSDELFDLSWRPGFVNPGFLWTTKRVLDIAMNAAKSINLSIT